MNSPRDAGGGPEDRHAAATTNYPPTSLPGSGDATGLQVAHIGTIRQAQALHEIMAPRQWATYVDLCWRWFETERRRPGVSRWLKDAA